MPIAKLLIFLIVLFAAWYVNDKTELVPPPVRPVARVVMIVIALIWIVVNINGLLTCCTI